MLLEERVKDLPKGMSRQEVKELFPEYDSLLAYEKMHLDNKLQTREAIFRNKFERVFEVAGTLVLPLYFAYCVVNSPDPDIPKDIGPFRFLLSVGIGYIYGKLAGMSIGTLVYEIFDREGEIRSFLKF